MPLETVYENTIQRLSILDENGNFDEELAQGTLSSDDVVALYKHMTTCRQLDEIAFKLQRSGRMGTYPQNKGQEAAAAGTAFALERSDWIVPCYRENAALFWHGLAMEYVLLHWMGDERGNQIPDGVNILPLSIPIGTHMLHAVGIAWAAKLRGEKTVSAAYFGDGATSEGDFHESMNFASTLKIPTVFVCQNNRWAISVPITKQMNSETVVQKALAYGMDCIQVDGNDLFAVYKAMKDAVARGRETSTPTFIEAVTYRMGDHTTADDARRYRDPAEVEAWQNKCPLKRLRMWMESRDVWDQSKQDALEAEAEEVVNAAVQRAFDIVAPSTDDIFDYTFEEIPDDLKRQRDTMRTHSLALYPEQETLQTGAGR